MGWSLALGHSPTAGLSFWDVRFRGERLLWELSLQVGLVWGGWWQLPVQYMSG
jgi:primary-amine oxidase